MKFKIYADGSVFGEPEFYSVFSDDSYLELGSSYQAKDLLIIVDVPDLVVEHISDVIEGK